ncbi:cytochrome o ubiquinol oxidase subunit IV [Govanella unica]|uniref:Cytochrome bo(3) ubiquinol oxidase subunit 4 n=1 Tax=Govanella unica TaxID=2975056 RepID=A0A9X3TWL4_9PROT|nr:cytochrome o ubiquinol oxidase subunit IV [Govania unica]MDA5193281.1 cytochrome o ubiquinol oxidase subunit IV [Govania unica]
MVSDPQAHSDFHDIAPGDETPDGSGVAEGIRGYVLGLFFAVVLTVGAFYLTGSDLVWEPGIPVALIVIAIAQMGVHLVFFLHVTTGPDSTNNVMALAFGVLIVFVVIVGSLWIMTHLSHNLMPMDKIMQMQR